MGLADPKSVSCVFRALLRLIISDGLGYIENQVNGTDIFVLSVFHQLHCLVRAVDNLAFREG